MTGSMFTWRPACAAALGTFLLTCPTLAEEAPEARAPAAERERGVPPAAGAPWRLGPAAQEADGALPTLVVTATRSPTPLEQVASSISVIEAEEIQTRNQPLVADLLRGTPGLDVRRTGGAGSQTSLFIRGANSGQTQLRLDGIKLNDPADPSRSPSIIAQLPALAVGQVEVLRGPQSGLYGSDAIGGVVNVSTRRGQGPPSARFWAEGGSYDTYRTGASFSGGDQTFDYAVSGSHIERDLFSARTDPGRERDAYRQTNASGRFGYRFSEAFGVDAVVHFIDSESEFDNVPPFGGEAGNQVETEMIASKVEPWVSLFDGDWTQRLALSLTNHDRVSRGDFPSEVEGRFMEAAWRHELTFIDGHRIQFGAEHETEEAEGSGFDERSETVSLYLQDQFEFGSRLFGSANVRWDDHSEFGSEVTWRVAAGYRLLETNTTIRGSAGTGFQAPSISQIHGFGGNPDLDAETSLGWDVGLEQSFADGALTIGATFFQNDFDDLIVGVFNPGTGSFQNFNIDEADSRGVEVSFAWEIAEPITFGASYTYTDTEAGENPATFGLESGSRLLRRPLHKAGMDLTWRFAGDRGRFRVDAAYVGERDDLDASSQTVTADDFFVVDLAAAYDVTEFLTVHARVDNLLDDEHEDVLGFKSSRIAAFGGVTLRF